MPMLFSRLATALRTDHRPRELPKLAAVGPVQLRVPTRRGGVIGPIPNAVPYGPVDWIGNRGVENTTETPSPIDSESIARVLAEVADIASETMELHEVFDRVKSSVGRLIPLDVMGVVRIVDGERVVAHAGFNKKIEGDGQRPEKPINAWSPRWRPQPETIRIDDARTEFDPTFPQDASVLDLGVQSVLWEPFRHQRSFAGGVFIGSFAARAYGAEHEKILRPIAAVLGSVVEHWRIWDAERRRRERLDKVETMLGTLAETLDVREIFQRLSHGLQTILPHHLMNLTEIDPRARTIRIVAYAGSADIAIRMDSFPLTTDEVEDRSEVAILRDVMAELPSEGERYQLIRASGMRSWLHLPVWLSGEVRGSLSFLHREPGTYGWDDTDVAHRVAARIALTLAHGKLAEEARVAAETRERAERLEATVETLARELESRRGSRVIGVSRSWKDVMRQVGRVAESETTVLVTGESGTGKEVVASLLHTGSARAGRPLVAINCAALPEQLLESELFGHERGAFTGAIASKVGRIEQSAGGTLFLDEIAEMSPQVQAKFLRVLEAREFQRVGGTKTIRADVRVVAATNRDLGSSLARGMFREDLYYRLNVFPIAIAPLRERREDILPLAEAFVEDLGRTMGRPAAGISQEGRVWLMEHPWPGNVRELRNAIERAILLCDGGLITRAHLPGPPVVRTPVFGTPPPVERRQGASPGPSPADPGVNLDRMERAMIEKALTRAKGNKSEAARLLGLTRAQLYSRLEKHEIQ